jgi:hypothetical protein
MNEMVLNGLVKRRAQLAGDIENTHEALPKTREQTPGNSRMTPTMTINAVAKPLCDGTGAGGGLLASLIAATCR